MTISPSASTVWRNFVTDGVPSSGRHKVEKAAERTWGTAVETVLNAFTTNGGLIYSTMSAMNAAASTFTEPRSAWQFETGYEGVYALNPSTDTWTKVGRLPYDFVIGTDVGTGTANAIQITTDIPVADGMIVAFSLFEATTASPVTVTINGGAALTLKTNCGNNASALSADMEIWGRVRSSDSTLRLLNDQDVSALVAQAETARDAAVAAAASVSLPTALTPSTIPVTNPGGTAREDLNADEVKTFLGLANTTRAFATATALLLAVVAEDHISVADVPMVADAGGTFLDSTGKKFKPAFWVTPKLYGAAGDGTTDDVTALRACWDAAGLYRVPVLMEGKEYNSSDAVYTSSNLTVHGQGAVMYITAWPAVGGFINNVRPVAADRVQSHIRIYDLITDGSKLPAPVSQNCNLMGFVRGASNVRVVNCIGRKMRDGDGGGTGGGAFGVEQGAFDVQFIGCVAEDCFRGFRAAGFPGEHSPGVAKRVANIVARDFTAIRCGTAVLCHSVGESEGDNVSDLGIFDVLIDGLYAEDCGHYPWRAFDYAAWPTIPPQKAGVIVLGGAQNVRIRGFRVKMNTGFPDTFTDWLGRTGYPATGDYIGVGLSGPVGALVRGWCRNVVVEDITLDGSVEVFWKCARSATFGDIATVSPTDGVNGTVQQIVFESIRHVRPGSYQYVFDGDTGLDNDVFSATMRVIPSSAPSSGVIGPNGTSALSSLMVEFISNAGLTQKGNAVEWLAAGNARPTGAQASYSLGGYDVGGGYSSTGDRNGQTYDAATGVLRSSRSVTTATYHLGVYNPNGLVGGVRSNASATEFLTTSDETLKDFLGEYDWKEAFRVIKADPVRDFTWKSSSEYAVGWGAQTSYAVSPDLAAKGGWFGPDGVPCEEGTVGAAYTPWGVDMGKRTPYLWAAVSRLIDEVAALKSELESLRA